MDKMADSKKEEDAKRRVKSGWIRVGMMIEALAISEDAAQSGPEEAHRKDEE